jgi:hypothetical protein
MAKLAPFFITGANAKVRVNNKTIAFCTDVSYSVAINHATPKILGMYESVSLEPLSYEVSGTFTVIRYAADVAPTNRQFGFNVPNGVADTGNGIGAVGPSNPVARQLSVSDGKAFEALDPSTYQNGTFFNIEVSQKMADGSTHGVARIRSCRIVRADFSLGGKTNPAIERFAFKALYVDEDSFLAGFSGIGQQFA